MWQNKNAQCDVVTRTVLEIYTGNTEEERDFKRVCVAGTLRKKEYRRKRKKKRREKRKRQVFFSREIKEEITAPIVQHKTGIYGNTVKGNVYTRKFTGRLVGWLAITSEIFLV